MILDVISLFANLYKELYQVVDVSIVFTTKQMTPIWPDVLSYTKSAPDGLWSMISTSNFQCEITDILAGVLSNIDPVAELKEYWKISLTLEIT